MKLHYDEATEAFRAEFLAWVDANLPPPEVRESDPRQSSAYIPAWGRVFQRKLFDDGWLVPGWPPELGGRNASPVEQLVYFEEVTRHQVPRAFNPQGLSIITPSIIDVGTPEQIERYALPNLRGEIAFALGMSEPGAGSDLAGLRTRAVLDGDHFVVNGQKVWTSGAQHADYLFAFVRTDTEVPKHQGISVLIIDMKSPGISVRPLPELTNRSYADFNEVFFSDVEVPAANLVGELNRGWSIAGGSLAHERGMLWITASSRLESELERLCRQAMVELPGGRKLADDPHFRSNLAKAYMESQALKFMGYRGFAKFARGMESPEHSILKLYGSELQRHLTLDVTDALGPLALDYDHAPQAQGIERDEPYPTAYLHSFSNTIAGGTSEIQHNIIAERVLGLPRR
jgi:alkylation response protein AidB-like acyl-CoA dehydrogenase